MAPVTKLRSIRLHNDLWAWLEGEAARRQLSVNGLVSALVEKERGERVRAATETPVIGDVIEKAVKARKAEREKAKLTLSVPLASDLSRKPYQKGQKK